MSPVILLDIDDKSNYILSGNIDSILNNSRLIFSLKRLSYKVANGAIYIPFIEREKINVLQEIIRLLEKFSIEFGYSDNTKEELSNFDREQRLFSEFTKRANDIRNDKFNDEPDLIEDFKRFQGHLAKEFKRTLYPLQLLSSFHIAFSQNACNFSVPGSGKTSIVLGAYSFLKSLPVSDARHVDKLLVIGPLSSFAPWEMEYDACFGKPPNSQRLSGDTSISRGEKEEHLYSGSPAELTLICHAGIDNLLNEIISFLKRNRTMVVIDEAHRVKNPEGIWGKASVEIAKQASARVILTGTPVPNGYEDLFNLFQFLYPFKYKDILGFHYPNLVDMTKNSTPDSSRVLELIGNISPFFMRIKKADLKLPPIIETVIEVEMDQNQREIYDFIESKYIRSFIKNGSATLKDVLNKAKLIRLRQAATNPSLLTKTIEETLNEEDYASQSIPNNPIPNEFIDDSLILSKIKGYSNAGVPRKFSNIGDLLKNIILNDKGKAIIWTVFIQNAKDLQNHLLSLGITSKLLIGEVTGSEREKTIKEFNDPENNDFPVVIANPFAVAESISLHRGCHNAIYMERDYNCSNYLQSKDRIHRFGLPSDQITNYYYILSKDSIDEIIHDRLIDKVRRMENIIDDDIPLFTRLNDFDETDIINSLIKEYARRTSSL